MASDPNIIVTVKGCGIVTEREAVLRERRAAARMRCAVMHELDLSEPCDKPCASCTDRAAEVHPLPKVPRPRILADPTDRIEWALVDGALRMRPCGNRSPFSPITFGTRDDWTPWIQYRSDSRTHPTAERVRVWADLFANPTELVPDDGSARGSL